MNRLLFLVTAMLTALSSGVFFAWSCSVVPGLKQLPDHTYISTMQSLNRAILNPVFFICFLGAGIALPLLTSQYYSRPLTEQFWLLAGASLFYMAGIIAVTLLGNVPLNDALDSFQLDPASVRDIADRRATFETAWNRLHTIRTVSGIISLALLFLAYGRKA